MAEEKKRSRIEPETPEMEALLTAGYGGMTLEEAKSIIKMHEDNPVAQPYNDRLKRAKAFIEAYKASPRPISTKPGWKRDPEDYPEI